MVCHAFRAGGGKQETFIGGGALAVEMRRNRSFFPNIYNEDWFFVLDAGKRLQPVATVGQVLQYPYDPYRVERARAEEFGDVLAEGIFWLLDQGKPASDGDLAALAGLPGAPEAIHRAGPKHGRVADQHRLRRNGRGWRRR